MQKTSSLGTTATQGILYLLWGVAFVAGIMGLYLRFSSGHRLAGYTTYVPWGLWVGFYQYLIVLAAGSFFIATALYLFGPPRYERLARLALLLSPVSLLSGLVLVWLDLGRMERFWRSYTSLDFSSIITWVIWLYTLFIPISLAALALAKRDDREARPRDRGVLRWLLVIGSLLAVGFSGGEGALFGVVGASPYWEPAFAILFVHSALVTGGATLLFLTAFFWLGTAEEQDAALGLLAPVTVGLLVLYVLIEAAIMGINLYSASPARAEAYRQLLAGPYWWTFRLVHVVLGTLVPVVIYLAWRRSPIALGIAAFLMALGLMAVRLNIVIPGQVVPALPGVEAAFVDPRLAFAYTPSLMEWLVSFFIASLWALLLFLGNRLVPLGVREPRAISRAVPAPSSPMTRGG